MLFLPQYKKKEADDANNNNIKTKRRKQKKTWLYHLPAVKTWAGEATSLHLCLLNYKMRIIIGCPSPVAERLR